MKSFSTSVPLLVFVVAAYAGSPFSGTWKLNREKTQYDANAGILKIEAEGSGIRYSVGAGSFPVYSGPLDGSERPGLGAMANDTFKLTKNRDRGYEAVQWRNGKAVGRQVVEVSPDGKTLTSSMTQLAPRKDGKQPTNVFSYKRTGGYGQPYLFIGTWMQDRKLTKWGEEPVPMIIVESGGVLTMSNTVNDTKTIIDLKKSRVTRTGESNPVTDVTATAKRIDERSFEVSTTRNGFKQNSLYSVSADGKTMTIRSTWAGDDGKPITTTSFYERQ
jgi:hypothetical protein